MKHAFLFLLLAGLCGQQARSQTIYAPEAAIFQVGTRVYYEVAYCTPGSQVAFYSNESGGRQLKMQQADDRGRVLTQVTEGEDFHPAFALNTLESNGSGRVGYFSEKEFNLQALAVSNITGAGVRLSWQAAVSPSAPLTFEVLRSINGSSYEVIGEVPGTGSNTLIAYRYTDIAGSATATYKIRVQHAQKGLRYTSQPLSALLNGLQVYPNATKDRFQVLATEEWLGTRYTIADAQGRVVLGGILRRQKDEMSIANLPPGSYFISFGNDQKKITLTLTKL